MPENPFIIVPCSPTWPEEFRIIAEQLHNILESLALRIDHIGSTAVPGLCSKDVIDIQITVANVHDPAAPTALSSAGFVHRPKVTRDHLPPGTSSPPTDWDKHFFIEAPGMRRANIHLRALGKPNQRYALLFRDYLRAHPAASESYAHVKMSLAARVERSDYIDIKDFVCDLIMQAAEMWARAGAWNGPAPQ